MSSPHIPTPDLAMNAGVRVDKAINSMSLLNLWKSIRGKSQAKTEVAAVAPAAPGETKPVVKRKLAKPTKPKRGILGFGSQGAICRLVKRSGATSVLEIGVGNGERALAVTKSLVDANPNTTVCYAAIDPFEMADGPISLKEFHQQLRAQDVKPTLVPMDTLAGLARISSTIGVVDLVLIAEPKDEINLIALTPALKRITNENSSVYQLEGEKWTKIDVHENRLRRAA